MRTERKLSKADIYHVVARGTGRQLIFEDDADRERFLGLLAKAMADEGVELYAWCLMGNHVHLLFHAPMSGVSACMKKACGSYARYFNDKSGRIGHLFQERFRSEPINDDQYLLTVLRYIHANPEKAGIAKLDSYAWSSYGEYVGRPRISSTNMVLEMFGSVESFAAFHQADSNAVGCLDVDPVRMATKAMPDGEALKLAADVLGGRPIDSVKSLARRERDEDLVKLKLVGLTIRQIERLTGIGRNTIARAHAE